MDFRPSGITVLLPINLRNILLLDTKSRALKLLCFLVCGLLTGVTFNFPLPWRRICGSLITLPGVSLFFFLCFMGTRSGKVEIWNITRRKYARVIFKSDLLWKFENAISNRWLCVSAKYIWKLAVLLQF